MSVKHLLITIDESKADYSGGIPLEAPAIEVVRCGDCEHYFEEWGSCMRDAYLIYEEDGFSDDSIEGMFDTEPDDHCKWGKRRQP